MSIGMMLAIIISFVSCENFSFRIGTAFNLRIKTFCPRHGVLPGTFSTLYTGGHYP